MCVSQIKFKSFINIYSTKKKRLLKFRGELYNLVLNVLEAPNMCYSLN